LRVLLRLTAFAILIIGSYTLFAAKYVPQGPKRGGAEVKEAGFDAKAVRAMSPRAFANLGKSIFFGKGSCSLCHNGRGRAPLLYGVAERAGARIKEARYRGMARDGQGYILESILRPSAYVVRGFGVPDGKGGTVSPMPLVMGPEIGLTGLEVKAVAAYLQSLSGLDITVTPETALDYAGKKTLHE